MTNFNDRLVITVSRKIALFRNYLNIPAVSYWR